MSISPYDLSKRLNLVIDGASSLGIGFILFQNVDDEDISKGALIVNANSSMLPKNKGNSPIVGELMALKFTTNCCHF